MVLYRKLYNLITGNDGHYLCTVSVRGHKKIRYVYDKYGYPLSKHINTSYTADFTYFLMKPLEWIFLIALYCVDKNPENRINVQYSELRKH